MALTQVDQGLLGTYAQYTGFKNRIINGAMGVWQRGTSGFTTSGNYAADRWIVQVGTSLSAVGQSSDVPSGYKYSLSIAGTNQPSTVQRIESVNCTDLVGQSVTVSVWIKQSVGAGSNSMYIWLGYANSADSFGSVTNISASNITATSSWAQYTVTFTNLPSGAANGLQIIIGCNGAGSCTFLITGVQLEKGSTATSFDYRPYGTELALCQRYFLTWVNGSGNIGLGGYYNSTYVTSVISFPVTMRAAPTLTQTTGTNYYGIYSNNTLDYFDSFSSGIQQATVNSAGIDCSTNVSGTSGSLGRAVANSGAFIGFSAEL
jgi:hypothetical protein